MMSTVVKESTARPVTPIGILTQQLEIMVQTLHQMTPDELEMNLKSAWQMAAGLDAYLEKCATNESPALAELAQRTVQEAWKKRFHEGTTVRELEQEMLSGHVEGQTLKMFIHMTRAKKVLEIGMFTGYSALAMAEAIPDDGYVVACEVDPFTAEFAQNCFNASPHGKKIRVELGPALDTLRKLVDAGESFDFVFIDADKKEYVEYFQTLLNTNLLAANGFICVDNTLFQGQVYLSERTPNGEAIAEFNRVVADDPRVEQVLLPLRDGLTVIRRLA